MKQPNTAALERLAAIAFHEAGNSLRKTAKRFGVHHTSVDAWVRKYKEGGKDSPALSAPRRKHTVYKLDPMKIRADIEADPENTRLPALLYLAEGHSLNETAARVGVSVQTIMNWRRDY